MGLTAVQLLLPFCILFAFNNVSSEDNRSCSLISLIMFWYASGFESNALLLSFIITPHFISDFDNNKLLSTLINTSKFLNPHNLMLTYKLYNIYCNFSRRLTLLNHCYRPQSASIPVYP